MMTYEYYILYDPERNIELEIRHHEVWGWEFNWSNPGGEDRWAKFEDRQLPLIEPHIKKYGYKKPRMIWTEEQYAAALGRIAELMDAKPGTIEYHELNKWADVVADYEDRTFPIPEPTPEDLAKFRKDQGMAQKGDAN